TTTTTSPPGTALGPVASPKMQLASATKQIGPVTTLQTTLTTIQNTVTTIQNTVTSLLTTTTTAPTTTTTAAPTTTTSITLPATTLPSTTTTTLDPNRQCTSNFRTYPNRTQVRQQVERRVPAGLWGFADGDFDIVYTYNDPSCSGSQPSDHHEKATAPACTTPIPNDPPPNSQVGVKITKTVTGPLGVFASIFDGSNKITANSGGETRGE